MVAAYNDGYSLDQIGVEHGVSRERVRQIIHGLVDRSAHEAAASTRAVGLVKATSEDCAKAYELYVAIGAKAATAELRLSPMSFRRRVQAHAARAGLPYPISHRSGCNPEAAYLALESGAGLASATETGGYGSTASATQSVRSWALKNGRPWPLLRRLRRTVAQ